MLETGELRSLLPPNLDDELSTEEYSHGVPLSHSPLRMSENRPAVCTGASTLHLDVTEGFIFQIPDVSFQNVFS